MSFANSTVGLRGMSQNTGFAQLLYEESSVDETTPPLLAEEASSRVPLDESVYMKCSQCFSRVFCCKRRKPASGYHSSASILPISNRDIFTGSVVRSSPSGAWCCSSLLRNYFRKRREQRFAPLFLASLSKQSERLEFLLALEKLILEEKIVLREQMEIRDLKKLGNSEAVKLFQERGYSESLLAEATSLNRILHVANFSDQSFINNPVDEKASQLTASFEDLRYILIQKQENIVNGGEQLLFIKNEMSLRIQEFDSRLREYEELYLQRCIQNHRVEELTPLFHKGDLDKRARIGFLNSLGLLAKENGLVEFESVSDLAGILRNLGEINEAVEVLEKKYPEIVWRKALAITQGINEKVANSSNIGKRWRSAESLCSSLECLRDQLSQQERGILRGSVSSDEKNDDIALTIEDFDRNWILFERALAGSWADVLTYTKVYESGASGSHYEFIVLMRQAAYICLTKKFFKLEDLEYCCDPSVTFVLPRLAMKVGFQYGLIGIGEKTMLPIISENFTELARLGKLQKQIRSLTENEDLFLEKKLAVVEVDETGFSIESKERVYSVYRQLCALGDEIQFVPGSKNYHENEDDIDSHGNRTNSWYSRFLQEVLDSECLQEYAEA
ncbi:MAG: hypothetical protein ACI9S8_000010 [Chlamydiales bacterium]|jgi:hypothetical protein